MVHRPCALLTAIASMASVSPAALAQTGDGAASETSAPIQHAPRANAVYVAGPNCPDESAFWDQVDAHRRNPDAIFLPVRVEVHELEGRARARVSFGVAPGPTATRELSASTCAEVAAAAALVVALALDAPLDEQKSPASPPAQPAEPPPPYSPPPLAVPDAPQPRARSASGLFWQLGAGALVQQAIAPSPMIGFSAFAGLGEQGAAWDARLSFVYAGSGVTERNDAAAEFSLLAGQIEACAFPLVRSQRFVVDPCLALELGELESTGVDNLRYSGEQRSGVWVAGGPLLRLRYAFNELWLELFGGPWIPIAGTREFVFEDPAGNRSYHRVPTVGLVGGLRAALHFD
jgi:hypothetical protein